MTTDEKIELIEKVIYAPEYSLQEDTKLNTLEGWESLNILNLQMELVVRGTTVTEEELSKCVTVGDICNLIN
jgi:acyl carrier protein